VEQHKMIFILNKSESLNENNILKIVDRLGLREDKKWIAISALTGKNIKELKKLIGEIFQNNISQKINNTGEKMHEN
jgi:GTP-binding protein HflX